MAYHALFCKSLDRALNLEMYLDGSANKNYDDCAKYFQNEEKDVEYHLFHYDVIIIN